MAKVVFRYNMFLEWFFSALIPQRLAVQFCRFGEFFFMCLLERVKMKKKHIIRFCRNAVRFRIGAGHKY
ncbi:TPA: hypothetical protein ACIVMO_001203 [Salmonella enterica subsp. salamae serovar 42:g,t:-]